MHHPSSAVVETPPPAAGRNGRSPGRPAANLEVVLADDTEDFFSSVERTVVRATPAKPRPSPPRAAVRARHQRWLRQWRNWALSAVLLGAMVAAGRWGWHWLLEPTTLPLRVVKIDGEVRHLPRQILEQAVTEAVRGGFFAIDLQAVCAQAERLAWVEKAYVRRVWPDTLVLRVIERVPFARWGEDSLVTQRGEVFTPEDGRLPQDLPRLAGPEGTGSEVVDTYDAMGEVLRPRGLRISRLGRDARGAWTLVLQDGPVLLLGRETPALRLARFARLYPALRRARDNADLERVDLRHANGFAVRWKPRSPESEPGGPHAAGRALLGTAAPRIRIRQGLG
jgi:cell division protein FtsQ